MDRELVALLRRLELNQYESRVYLALLSAGPASASEVSDLAAIPRPRTYDVLDKLEKKGFVTVQPGRPTKFRAAEAREAFAAMARRKQEELDQELAEIEAIRKELEAKVKAVPSPGRAEAGNFVWVLKERDAIYAKLASLLESATKYITIATTPDGLKRKLAAYEDVLRRARARGVEVRIVAPAEAEHAKRAADFAKVVHRDHGHRAVIVDDHVVLFLTPEGESKKEVSAWVASPYFAQAMRRLI